MPIVSCSERIEVLLGQRSRQWQHLQAIEASDAAITYQELQTYLSRFASVLSRLEITEGEIVPLYMTKSAAMFVAMIAILKVGSAYAPLPTDSPRQRTLLLLKQLNSRHIVNTKGLENDVHDLPIRATCCNINSLMVLGTPKGVMIEYTALSITILENGRRMNYEPKTRTLSFAAYTFDVNVMETYLTLLHGGCLFVPSKAQRLQDLPIYINRNSIEMAFLTPTAIKNLLKTPSLVPSLKTLRVGEEPLSRSILELWAPRVWLINSYGSTETCVDACRNAHVQFDTDPSNIGFPISTHLWVVKPGNRSQLAPLRCPGELLISGPTLAQGYFNDQQKTRETFIDGSSFPWVLSGESRLYTIGDLVRQNPDGSIVYLGRRDLQLKVNGHRIETSEIESLLESCSDISLAIIEKFQLEEEGSEVLVAFLALRHSPVSNEPLSLLSRTDHSLAAVDQASRRAEHALLPYMRP
ncbi:MAG: hypothetical protein Q9219_002067 [cf. Caloplaca sp. 3 TL-2023]